MTASNPLGVGDKMPSFTLADENSNLLNINDFLGKSALVIYFYPKDDTPGCTIEACSFRDHFEEFEDLGAKVIGISTDPPGSHLRFKQKYNLPFTLLSDYDRKVQRLFGVRKNFLGMLDGRVTYVVDKKGVIRHVFSSQLWPKKHIEEALTILNDLDKK